MKSAFLREEVWAYIAKAKNDFQPKVAEISQKGQLIDRFAPSLFFKTIKQEESLQ